MGADRGRNISLFRTGFDIPVSPPPAIVREEDSIVRETLLCAIQGAIQWLLGKSNVTVWDDVVGCRNGESDKKLLHYPRWRDGEGSKNLEPRVCLSSVGGAAAVTGDTFCCHSNPWRDENELSIFLHPFPKLAANHTIPYEHHLPYGTIPCVLIPPLIP